MTVFVGGVFDLFHIGHLRILEKAKKLGDRLVVGVLTDAAAAVYKDKPIIPFIQRMEIVRALKCVDEVVELTASDGSVYFKENSFYPDILVHGTDHTPDWEIGQTYVQDHGGMLVLLPYTEGISSTKIKKQIRSKK